MLGVNHKCSLCGKTPEVKVVQPQVSSIDPLGSNGTVTIRCHGAVRQTTMADELKINDANVMPYVVRLVRQMERDNDKIKQVAEAYGTEDYEVAIGVMKELG